MVPTEASPDQSKIYSLLFRFMSYVKQLFGVITLKHLFTHKTITKTSLSLTPNTNGVIIKVSLGI